LARYNASLDKSWRGYSAPNRASPRRKVSMAVRACTQ